MNRSSQWFQGWLRAETIWAYATTAASVTVEGVSTMLPFRLLERFRLTQSILDG